MDVRVMRAGLSTSTQDGGRPGFLGQGIARGGFADARAAHVGNVLVGNRASAACLEFFLEGPTLEFATDAVAAVTGADVEPLLDGHARHRYQAFPVKRGQTLEIGHTLRGQYGYICFAGGGLASDVSLGSRSANFRAGLPGTCGRALAPGDKIALLAPDIRMLPRMERRTVGGEDLSYGFSSEVLCVRAIPMPHETMLTSAGRRALWNETYAITGRSDRMGCRLDGPPIELVRGSDVVSQGIPLGAIEVPARGLPIVMLADHQTTGGYAVPACVATIDLDLLVQRRPGQLVRFTRTTVFEAQEALRRDRRALERLGESLAEVDQDDTR